jgi:predicted HTH domain antitoxin
MRISNTDILVKNNSYTRKEASKILGIPREYVSRLIKNNILQLIVSGERASKITSQSLFAYRDELEERKKIKKPVWIHRNDT